MIASDLASLIDALESTLTGKDERMSLGEPATLLVRRNDLREMLKFAVRLQEMNERPLNLSLHDIEISCGASRITKEIG